MWITTDEAVEMHARFLVARYGRRASRLAREKASSLHESSDLGGHKVWNEVADAVHPLGAREIRALRRLQREMPEDVRSVHIFLSERQAPLSVAGYQRMVARAGEA